MQKGAAVSVGHEVQALCGAAGKHDLGLRGCVYEACHGASGLLVQVGGLLREVVHAAMHVGVHLVVFLHHGLYHRAGFLRGGGVVKVNQGAAVHLAGQYGKVLPDGVNVVHIYIRSG